MNNEELKELLAENALAIRDLIKLIASVVAETERVAAETKRIAADAERRATKQSEETSRQIREVNREIGHIGNTFGRFTEGLFTPSLDRILLKDFGLDTIGHRVQRRYKDSMMEIDVLGYSNSEKNAAFVVEIKSKLRDDDIKEFIEILKKFPKVYTEHKDKKIIGVMAAVNISAEQKAALEKNGIYVVGIHDDVFRVVSGKKFEPKNFGLKA